MRTEERDAAYLWDMLDASQSILRILEGCSLEEFVAEKDDIVRFAVERKLEVLGEAARRVSIELRERHPQIPWKDIIGLRNIISHQYEKVNYEEIYRVCSEGLPQLVSQLISLLPPPPGRDE